MPQFAVIIKRITIIGVLLLILREVFRHEARPKYTPKHKYSQFYKNNSKNVGPKRNDLSPVLVYRGSEQRINDTHDIGLVRTREEREELELGFKNVAFNTLVSRRIGRRRDIPDTRHKTCREYTWEFLQLPSASIIICFYNEDLNTLLRTVSSVIDRSPDSLVTEIILVNDYSDNNITEPIVNEITSNPSWSKVKLLNAESRKGLIRARIMGAREASGDVLVFLDSHVECNQDWLQPLLSRIRESEQNVVTPIIDVIDPDTFKYKPSPLVRGGFNWGLNFKWESLVEGALDTEEKFSQPILSPTMAGGLFAIDRKYFHYLGEYDPGLEIWGGENLEISFRIWMCGGRLEIIPCSRVGHVFRKRRPYSSSDKSGVDTQTRNSARVARVWLDEYIKYFHETVPGSQDIHTGDISDRVALREQLSCHNFSWYHKNIYPELEIPGQEKKKKKDKGIKFQRWDERKRNYVESFQLEHVTTRLCAAPESGLPTKGSGIIVKNCIRTRDQVWYTTDNQELVSARLLCLDSGKSTLRLMKCHEMGSGQDWQIQQGSLPGDGSRVYSASSGQCLVVQDGSAKRVTLGLCDSANVWNVIPVKLVF